MFWEQRTVILKLSGFYCSAYDGGCKQGCCAGVHQAEESTSYEPIEPREGEPSLPNKP